ncbi:ATP-binding protein [Nocardiopsis ansamitocini]|uniref:Histidine kinase/HSP90-like ATPase domain-containing protein n=1 Tax=Nocardiopsis ansamitocini TaxID=1670832 RepID=A0A9W6PAA8_9ACTN|nr:ATP-binding protein [Nocardiopsis ansamitocini]GLU50519.1 hypothetical protein Nans01_48700 [Nocardiopsis ansamitocini]
MTIVPHTPAPASAHDHHRPARVYPGTLAHTARVRADLAADLAALPGVPAELAEEVVLCVSEAFANAVAHTRSGGHDGRVVRTLSTTATAVRVAVIDDGADDTLPEIPHRRTPAEWDDAEHGRGLLIVGALATAWGTRPVVASPLGFALGTVTWAEFALPATTGTRPAQDTTASEGTR